MVQEICRSLTLQQEMTNVLFNCLTTKVGMLSKIESRDADQQNTLLFDSHLLNIVAKMGEAERTQQVFLEMLQRTLQQLLSDTKL